MKPLFAAAYLALCACGSGGPPLPQHSVSTDSLEPRAGERVQIDVTKDISKEQCEALLDRYREKAEPGGQVSVRKPSDKLGGQSLPWCVDNLEGEGVTYNDMFFE